MKWFKSYHIGKETLLKTYCLCYPVAEWGMGGKACIESEFYVSVYSLHAG